MDNNTDFGVGIFVGFLLTITVFLIAGIAFDIADGNPCVEAEELFDGIRVMHTTDLGSDCKLITDQGFAFYHDGMLFLEAK